MRHGIDWVTTFQRFDDADGDAPTGWPYEPFEILGILTTLGVRDDRMDQALALVAAKQDADGRWDLANTFNGRFVVDVEAKGAPSRWITARALDVLAAQYAWQAASAAIRSRSAGEPDGGARRSP